VVGLNERSGQSPPQGPRSDPVEPRGSAKPSFDIKYDSSAGRPRSWVEEGRLLQGTKPAEGDLHQSPQGRHRTECCHLPMKRVPAAELQGDRQSTSTSKVVELEKRSIRIGARGAADEMKCRHHRQQTSPMSPSDPRSTTHRPLLSLSDQNSPPSASTGAATRTRRSDALITEAKQTLRPPAPSRDELNRAGPHAFGGRRRPFWSGWCTTQQPGMHWSRPRWKKFSCRPQQLVSRT